MKKKFITSSIILATLFSFFCFSSCFAADNVADGVKNVASDAGNTIKAGVDATKNTVSNVANKVTGTTSNMVNGTENAARTTGTNAQNTTNYTATRTNTNTAKLAGMTATGWTWLIMAIFGVAIVAIVWFYGKQHTESSSSNNND